MSNTITNPTDLVEFNQEVEIAPIPFDEPFQVQVDELVVVFAGGQNNELVQDHQNQQGVQQEGGPDVPVDNAPQAPDNGWIVALDGLGLEVQLEIMEQGQHPPAPDFNGVDKLR